MTEEVLISVTGLHTLDTEDEDQVEVFSAGKYYSKNGKHYVFYEEADEQAGAMVKNRITLEQGRMEVKKTGAVQAQLIFEEKNKNTSWYNTPFGPLMTGIQVQEMQITEQEQQLEALIDYKLEINGEQVADSQIRVKVMNKDSGLFRLK